MSLVCRLVISFFLFFFFFNDTATTEIYTLSLHDALPISWKFLGSVQALECAEEPVHVFGVEARDRKSTRLNSSHANISYAVFCLKKKNDSTDSIAAPLG